MRAHRGSDPPENTVELDFPRPLEDWAGRGFTPDAEKFAGDFVIEANRGKARLFVTPVAAGAHRVLDIVLAEPGSSSRASPWNSCPLRQEWRGQGGFGADRPSPEPRLAVSLSPRPPGTRLREPSPESEIGLIETLRLVLDSTAESARGFVGANPALELAALDGVPRSFGDFTVAPRFALRDGSTDTLGICAQQLAQAGLPPVNLPVQSPAPAVNAEEWQPLGVFALSEPGQSQSNMLLQMAVNRNGVVHGNYYNQLTNEQSEIYGSLDKQTQRISWTIGSNTSTVFDASFGDLVKDDASVLVHDGPTNTQRMLLFRLQQPVATPNPSPA